MAESKGATAEEIITIVMALINAARPPEALPDHLALIAGMPELYSTLTNVRAFAVGLAAGDLERPLPVKGFLPGVLKSLQANLNHLAWQTKQIAAGDFSQHVDFMGEFSQAFNSMAEQLDHALTQLRKSEHHFRTVADHTYAWEYWLGLDLRFVWVSPSCETVTGYSAQEFMANPELLVSIVLPEDRPLMEEHMSQVLDACELAILDFRIRTKSDEVRWLSHYCLPVYDDHGQLTGRRASNSDITERKQGEEFREQVERLIRHDLRAPVATLSYLPMLIEAEGGLNAAQREYLDHIRQYTKRMLSMLESSLALMRIEQGTFELDPHDVDIAALVHGAWTGLTSLTKAKQLQLKFSGDGSVDNRGTFLIPGDEMLLATMLENLLKNAAEASPEDSTVEVSLERAAEVAVRVHNHGAVPEIIRANFFDKFATSGKRHGTGLGTYSAQLVARAHKGRIGMETSEESGTTVTVYLPFATP